MPGGTGLGLYVARQIVQAHDGKLWLAEHGPDGCTFILTLPRLLKRRTTYGFTAGDN
nr:Sensor protein kinase walK [Klebsiella pneumoniae]